MKISYRQSKKLAKTYILAIAMKKVKSLSNAIGGKTDIKECVTQKTLPFYTILQKYTAISLIII